MAREVGLGGGPENGWAGVVGFVDPVLGDHLAFGVKRGQQDSRKASQRQYS